MESTTTARVLVVAHKTAATPALIEAVRERAGRGPSSFTLLVPNPAHGLHRIVDPEDIEADEAQQTIELATPLLEQAAGGKVESIIGTSEPLAAIQDAMNLHGGFDELIISTLPADASRAGCSSICRTRRRVSACRSRPSRRRASSDLERALPGKVTACRGFCIYMQVLIVIFVLAGMVIAVTKL